MDVQATKLELIEKLLSTNNEELLSKIYNLFRKETDWWNELNRTQQEELKEGLAQLDRGEKHDYEEVMSKHRK